MVAHVRAPMRLIGVERGAEKPEAVPYSDLADPQSLNLYTYVRNNPVSRTDPDGHCEPVGCAIETVHVLQNAGSYLEDFAVGAVKKLASNVESNFTDPSASLKPSNDVQEAGAKALETAIVVGALLSDVKGGGEGEPVSGDSVEVAPKYESTPENIQRMKEGKAPVGKDGSPVELHHEGQQPNGKIQEMTRQEHRVGENFAKNHPNTGKEPTRVDRTAFKHQRRQYWKQKGNQQPPK